MKTKLILFITVIITQSCAIMLNKDELTNERTDYTGNAFRLDGCYINNMNYKGQCWYNFFYRNGIMLTFNDSCGAENVTEFSINTKFEKTRTPWTIFHIDGDKVTVKYWTSYPELFTLDTALDTYKIINDTTLSHLNTEGETVYYNFKKFTSKPDSINPFIK